jgi:hypothetical protein
MMKNVVGVLLKYFAGFFPQSMEKASFSEQKLQLCQGIITKRFTMHHLLYYNTLPTFLTVTISWSPVGLSLLLGASRFMESSFFSFGTSLSNRYHNNIIVLY